LYVPSLISVSQHACGRLKNSNQIANNEIKGKHISYKERKLKYINTFHVFNRACHCINPSNLSICGNERGTNTQNRRMKMVHWEES
jgi:hypothetical protein